MRIYIITLGFMCFVCRLSANGEMYPADVSLRNDPRLTYENMLYIWMDAEAQNKLEAEKIAIIDCRRIFATYPGFSATEVKNNSLLCVKEGDSVLQMVSAVLERLGFFGANRVANPASLRIRIIDSSSVTTRRIWELGKREKDRKVVRSQLIQILPAGE